MNILLCDSHQTWIDLNFLNFLPCLSSFMHPNVYHLISVEEVFFLLFSKFIFPPVPWIYLPSSSSCSIGHSFCYPGSLPPPFLLGLLSIWQGVAQIPPAGGLWLPGLMGAPTLYSHSVPNILRALGIWGVCAWFPHYRVNALRVPAISYLWGVGVQVNESNEYMVVNE